MQCFSSSVTCMVTTLCHLAAWQMCRWWAITCIMLYHLPSPLDSRAMTNVSLCAVLGWFIYHRHGVVILNFSWLEYTNSYMLYCIISCGSRTPAMCAHAQQHCVHLLHRCCFLLPQFFLQQNKIEISFVAVAILIERCDALLIKFTGHTYLGYTVLAYLHVTINRLIWDDERRYAFSFYSWYHH